VAIVVEAMGHQDLVLAALHHDSHEAYACDIPKPLKCLLDPRYTEITNRLDRAIATALELPVLNLEDERARPIKDADDAMLVLEGTEYLAGDPPDRDLPTGLLDLARVTVEVKKSMTPDEAKDSFLAFHERLTQL
jgi:5'-deoxynucleotidase YfbR-like HD superfamily hydrolase